jgi:hypothetical protein
MLIKGAKRGEALQIYLFGGLKLLKVLPPGTPAVHSAVILHEIREGRSKYPTISGQRSS